MRAPDRAARWGFSFMAEQKFVRLEITKERRVKLQFKHKQLREAVRLSGRSIGELVGDPFGGWPYLITEGHRPFDPTISIDKASQLIDEWVELPDPNTGTERSLAELAEKLLEAVKASQFVVIKPDVKDDDEVPEGKDQKPDA